MLDLEILINEEKTFDTADETLHFLGFYLAVCMFCNKRVVGKVHEIKMAKFVIQRVIHNLVLNNLIAEDVNP